MRKWEELGAGRFDIVSLSSVRLCDPLVMPLNRRDTNQCAGLLLAYSLGCASMEKSHPLGER